MEEQHLCVTNQQLSYGNFTVKKILRYEEEGAIYIELENETNLLMEKEFVYNVSDYGRFLKVFLIKGVLYGGFQKGCEHQVINLKTSECIFNDSDVYSVIKHTEDYLYIIKNTGSNKIYNISNREYLEPPENYAYESDLGNDLFVYVEKESEDEKVNGFYDLKRIIVNSIGEILLNEVQGYPYYKNNKIYIIRDNSISIASIQNDSTLQIKTVEPNDTILVKPQYSDGNIIIVEKNKVKIYNGDLEEIKVIEIDNLEEVSDSYKSGDVLYLKVPYELNGEMRYKILLINFKNKNIVIHKQIEWYPYWAPTTFVATDDITSSVKEYYFYNKDLNNIASIKACGYDDVDCANNESIFLLETPDNKKNILYNCADNIKKEVDYTEVKFHSELPYGYAIDINNNKMDFLDRNLNVIISDFDMTSYDLYQYLHQFSYWIINQYIAFTIHFIDEDGISRTRNVLQSISGEIIFDSLIKRCIPMGDFFQIVSSCKTKFLNTITGKKGKVELISPVNENGEIDFKKVQVSLSDLSFGGILDSNLETEIQKIKTNS